MTMFILSHSSFVMNRFPSSHNGVKEFCKKLPQDIPTLFLLLDKKGYGRSYMVSDRNVKVTLPLIPYLMAFVSNPPDRTRMKIKQSDTILPTLAFIPNPKYSIF